MGDHAGILGAVVLSLSPSLFVTYLHNLLTYSLTYLLTYSLTYSLTYLLTDLLTYLLTYLLLPPFLCSPQTKGGVRVSPGQVCHVPALKHRSFYEGV